MMGIDLDGAMEAKRRKQQIKARRRNGRSPASEIPLCVPPKKCHKPNYDKFLTSGQ